MKGEELNIFEQYLHMFTRKNSRPLGERTINGILTLAKFIESSNLIKI